MNSSGKNSIWVIGIFLVFFIPSIPETEGRRFRTSYPGHVHGLTYKNLIVTEKEEDENQRQTHGVSRAIGNIGRKPQGRFFGPIISIGLNFVHSVLTGAGSGWGPFGWLISVVKNALVRVIELGRTILKWAIEANKRREDRAGFIKGIAYLTDYVTEGLCNILVYNISKDYSGYFYNIIDYQKVKHVDGTPIGVWVISSGYFNNLAFLFRDDHWAYSGSYYFKGYQINYNHRDCPAYYN